MLLFYRHEKTLEDTIRGNEWCAVVIDENLTGKNSFHIALNLTKKRET